jgi:hypothetical protein
MDIRARGVCLEVELEGGEAGNDDHDGEEDEVQAVVGEDGSGPLQHVA